MATRTKNGGAPGRRNRAKKTLAVSMVDHPFLTGLKPRHLEILLQHAMPVQFEPDEMIVHEGDLANRFYLIHEGKVLLEADQDDREPMAIQTIGGGDVLGWSWLLSPYRWHFSARAVEPTKATFFYGTRLRELCDENHALGYELARRVSEILLQRLNAAMRQLLIHY